MILEDDESVRLKPSFQLNAVEAAELDTIHNPFHAFSPQQPHTLVNSTSQGWDFDPNEPPEPLSWDELNRIIHLKLARGVCIGALNAAKDIVDQQTINLNEIDEELSFFQYGRQYKGQGGTYNHKNASHNNNDSGTNQSHQSNNANVPSFMNEYLPMPEAGSPREDDQPGARRCTVGKPRGIVMQRGTRYYDIGRCDKHSDKTVFLDNLKSQLEGEKGYMLNEHAWKCSGVGTRRPLTETRHR